MIETPKFSLNGFTSILSLLFLSLFIVLVPGEVSQGKDWIYFSDYVWKVKHHIRNTMGPGPNYWSASSNNVWVDESGHLHLKITKKKGRWYASEVQLDQPMGYGTYKFTVDLPEKSLDRNVVLGLFNYLTDRKEFDVEVTKWGENSPTNIQFVVQPSEQDENIKRFPLNPTEGTKKVFSYTWTREELIFRCENCANESCTEKDLLEKWKYRGEPPPRGDLITHINLWLLDGKPPTDGKEVEVIVEDFAFSPLE